MSTTSLSEYSELYDRYAPALYGIILRSTGDPQQADKILEESFMEMMTTRQQYQPRQSSLFAWMYNITRKELQRQHFDINQGILMKGKGEGIL